LAYAIALKKEVKIMTSQYIGGSVLVLTLFLCGCSTADPSATSGVPATEAPRLVTQGEASDLTFQYRRQAQELREMARRMEIEARWYGGRFGENDERALDSRDKAKELWTAAQEADQISQEYRRQIPHGQVY
jgi:hypothetical protein